MTAAPAPGTTLYEVYANTGTGEFPSPFTRFERIRLFVWSRQQFEELQLQFRKSRVRWFALVVPVALLTPWPSTLALITPNGPLRATYIVEALCAWGILLIASWKSAAPHFLASYRIWRRWRWQMGEFRESLWFSEKERVAAYPPFREFHHVRRHKR